MYLFCMLTQNAFTKNSKGTADNDLSFSQNGCYLTTFISLLFIMY